MPKTDDESHGMLSQLTTWAWNNRKSIEQKLSQLHRWIRDPKQKGILIIGPGGVGKTTLASMLAGQFNFLLDGNRPYTESLTEERVEYQKSPKISLLVPPGQEHRRPSTWTDALKNLANGKSRGVIIISAYGYHSLGMSYKKTKHFVPSMSEASFLKKYLADRQADEIRVLGQILDSASKCEERIWVLSVISKQDLWHDTDSLVRDHYLNGKYSQIVSKWLDKADEKRTRHEFVFGSLTIRNFATTASELLQPNCAGFDHSKQVDSLRHLLEVVDSLRKWG